MKTEALIVGGGMAGLTLAALLGDAGVACVVVDSESPAPNPKPTGRTVALMDGSINVLKAAGIWKGIKGQTAPLNILRIIDDSQPGMDPLTIDFKPGDIGLGAFGHNIPHLVLRGALAERVAALNNVTHLTGTQVKGFSVTPSGVQVETGDGKNIEAKIIIGTDGRKSIVRRISGIGADEKEYGQTAITCLIDHSRPHDNISAEHHRPGGPFTYVPLPGQQSSIVWVEKTEDAKAYLSLKKPEFEKALQDRMLSALGSVTLASAPESWPLMTLKAHTLIAPRAAIAAEAAHVFSPIGAQGLNLSLRDIASLAETLVDAARMGEDIGSDITLRRYQVRRQTDIHTRVAGVNGLNKIVSNNIGFLRGLRRAGLRTLESLPALRQFAMHQGLAPAMDDSRLARGQML